MLTGRLLKPGSEARSILPGRKESLGLLLACIRFASARGTSLARLGRASCDFSSTRRSTLSCRVTIITIRGASSSFARLETFTTRLACRTMDLEDSTQRARAASSSLMELAVRVQSRSILPILTTATLQSTRTGQWASQSILSPRLVFRRSSFRS